MRSRSFVRRVYSTAHCGALGTIAIARCRVEGRWKRHKENREIEEASGLTPHSNLAFRLARPHEGFLASESRV